MQNVSFRSVEEFLEYLPDEELLIVEYLREIIYECIPDCREKLAYNVPYFKRYSNICFVWPASVTWGSEKSYEGVRLGFVNGYLLQDDINYLQKEGRKQVFWKDYLTLKDIDTDLVKMFLFEAVLVDEIRYKEKKR